MIATGAVAAHRSVWRIIVVDDNPDDRAEVRRMLLKGSDRRYHFEEAETGRAALELVAAHPDGPPRCLLLDYFLPDMDALDALAQLTGPDGVTHCPVVVMTGAVGMEAGKAVLHAGAQDYIGKDWLTPPAITRVIENAVDRFDLTRQLRERDAAIRESEARLRLALEASATGLWTWDVATDAVTYNPQCYKIFGLTPEGFDHTHAGCLALIHPQDRHRVEAACEQAIRDHALFEAEFRVIRPDGSLVWVMHRARADYDHEGRPVRLLGTSTDITPRKQAEEATLRRHELQAQLARIAESAPGMIFSVELDDAVHGTMPFSTPAIGDLFGVTQEQAARDYTCILAQIHPDDLPSFRARIQASIDAASPWHDKFRYRHPSKGERWIEGWASPRSASKGNAVWHGFAMDVTDREKAQAALTENDRRKDVFLAMLGHELRNPLATIRVASQVLGTPQDAFQADWARDVIHDQVDHLARLLDDLLDVSRITRGAIRIEKRPIDAAAIVHKSVEALRHLIEARRHTLDLDLGPAAIPLEADPDRLEQVVSNLVGNAAKYTAPGGHIQIKAYLQGEDVVVRVRDNGAGISPEDLPRLFEPFVQGARTLDRSEGGMGIGLAVAALLVRLHGGRIEARSDGPGTGSEFLAILPRGDAPLAPPAVALAPRRKAPARVLIVDDNRELARGLAQLLGALGHNVQTAFDGPAGLAAVQDAPPDVILLDLGLPVIDGYEVARTIRGDSKYDAVRIIAISGYAQEEDRRRSSEVGINHHLAKPVDLRALAELL